MRHRIEDLGRSRCVSRISSDYWGINSGIGKMLTSFELEVD